MMSILVKNPVIAVDASWAKQMSNELETRVNASFASSKDREKENSFIFPEKEYLHYEGRHYDLIYENYCPVPNVTTLDIPFWLDMASQYGDPILELSCGTGRIAIPLANKGFQVTGIDIGDSMLELARKKSAQVEWIKADIQNFDLAQKFNLIIFPINCIWHLLDIEAVEACFACVKKHLKPGGKFVIDMLNPATKASLDMLFDPKKNLYSIYPNPDGEGTVVVTASNELNLTQQIYKTKLFFKLVGEEQERIEEITYRLYFPQELEALLRYNGFKIEKKFGAYDRSVFSDASFYQITVCSVKE
ncbi:MAG: class I SAM-dependent methyltransferase [Aulosira sp. ZfuVER01]|nr:class I SAM-dependent methyltransferase [Aulosira sp. ZfuVER01]MDZ7999956.1 class I SAM-dependent methyltransferase [Aulosira sp. DedVER01a]MDZ8051395.1 class I SAM-dependent methyltransferase [Aulosira sp. ZfuCHP01]